MYDTDTDAASTTTPVDRRHRTRLFVALYGLALVVLLLVGSWVAPADASGPGDAAPNGGWVEVSGDVVAPSMLPTPS